MGVKGRMVWQVSGVVFILIGERKQVLGGNC